MNFLTLSWSISKGRDTAGYNICRLDDMATGERFKCMGGGYDMTGTVFGEWLQKNFQSRLMKIKDRFSKYENGKFIPAEGENKQYGGTYHVEKNVVNLDGACGIETMLNVAKEIGLEITSVYNKRRDCTEGFSYYESDPNAGINVNRDETTK